MRDLTSHTESLPSPATSMLHVCLLSFRTVSENVTCTSTFRVFAMGDPVPGPTTVKRASYLLVRPLQAD